MSGFRHTPVTARDAVAGLRQRLTEAGHLADPWDAPDELAVALVLDRGVSAGAAFAACGVAVPEPEAAPTVPFSDVPVGGHFVFNAIVWERITIPLGAHYFRGHAVPAGMPRRLRPNAFGYRPATESNAPAYYGGLAYIGPERRVQPVEVPE